MASMGTRGVYEPGSPRWQADPMSSVPARPATSADLEGMSTALADAFHDDPVMAAVFGGDEQRRTRWLRPFFRGVGSVHLRHQLVFTTDDHGGASYWDPPGHWQTRPRDYFPIAVPMLLGVNRRIPKALRGMGRIEAVHKAQPQDHYYLSVLGTRTTSQGKGIGSALMEPVLEVCDRDGVGAYLESSKERNVPFYRRHGFKVVEEIEFASGGPTLWAMWRDPQPRETGSG
jgi:ribosomal protein S18 acetylase RimI-like enzyme